MKAFWSRTYLWFFFTFVGVSTVFLGAVAYFQIHHLRLAHPTRPWISLSPVLLLLYGIVVAIAFVGSGWLATRASLSTIGLLSHQIGAIDPRNLHAQVLIDTHEPEFEELQKHLNGLLSRISSNVDELQSYSARVAHQLRGQLTLIRLKIEEAADQIEPAFAKEIQAELLRLTAQVEQALVAARDDQKQGSARRLL
jgi:signal transduction histidine kinase